MEVFLVDHGKQRLDNRTSTIVLQVNWKARTKSMMLVFLITCRTKEGLEYDCSVHPKLKMWRDQGFLGQIPSTHEIYIKRQ